jgi:hypothetical protein
MCFYCCSSSDSYCMVFSDIVYTIYEMGVKAVCIRAVLIISGLGPHVIRPLPPMVIPLIRADFRFSEVGKYKCTTSSSSTEATLSLQNVWPYTRGLLYIVIQLTLVISNSMGPWTKFESSIVRL